MAAAWHPCAQQALDGLGWSKATEGFTQWTPQGSSQAANALIASGQQVAAILNDDYMDEFYKAYTDREHGSAGDLQRRPTLLLVPGR